MKKLLSLCLCVLLLSVHGISLGATYQVTEQEMQQLNSNSQRLSEINAILQLGSTESQKTLLKVSKELAESRAELQVLKAELQRLQDNLQIAKSLSQSQQDLLQKTNESFQKYSQEQKSIQRQLKTERTILSVLVIGLGTAYLVK